MISFLEVFLRSNRLGLTTGPDGIIRLAPGLVRIPDVAFFSWDHFPGRRVPRTPIPNLVPDLAVEILGDSNTEAETARKCRDLFDAGTRFVWFVEPDPRTVRVYESPTSFKLVTSTGMLTREDLLPGFSLSAA